MRIDKYVYRTKADIFVSGFCCTPQNTVSLAEMLSNQSIVMLTDESPEMDVVLKLLKQYQIQHFFHSNKRRNAWLVFIPVEHKYVITQMVQKWDIGSILLFNLKDDMQWQECCHNIFKLSPKYLTSKGMSSMTIVINFDEDTCEIHTDLSSYNVNEIVEYIKTVSSKA